MEKVTEILDDLINDLSSTSTSTSTSTIRDELYSNDKLYYIILEYLDSQSIINFNDNRLENGDKKSLIILFRSYLNEWKYRLSENPISKPLLQSLPKYYHLDGTGYFIYTLISGTNQTSEYYDEDSKHDEKIMHIVPELSSLSIDKKTFQDINCQYLNCDNQYKYNLIPCLVIPWATEIHPAQNGIDAWKNVSNENVLRLENNNHFKDNLLACLPQYIVHNGNNIIKKRIINRILNLLSIDIAKYFINYWYIYYVTGDKCGDYGERSEEFSIFGHINNDVLTDNFKNASSRKKEYDQVNGQSFIALKIYFHGVEP